MRIIVLFLILIYSCKQEKIKNSEESSKTESLQKNIKKIKGINEIESLSFRRTYVGHENLTNKELDELYKSNPNLETYDKNSEIVKKLNEHKLLKNSELILSSFDGKKFKNEYLDFNKKTKITYVYDSEYLSKITFKVTKDNKEDIKTLDFKGDHILGIILKDIDNNGIKEILILTNYYIMNGDNFVITILEYT